MVYCGISTLSERNGPHETGNCKSKTAIARNKAKSYVAALTTIDTGPDDELVASVNKQKAKRNKGKGKTTKKNAKKRKVDKPPVSNSDIDTDSLYDVSKIEDSE